MPKQAPRNGFYYFMLDFRARLEREGRRFPGGLEEVSKAASPEWNNLPQREKDDYNDYAKENRGNEVRKNVPKRAGKKYNSMGQCLAEVEKQEQEKKEKEESIKIFVEKFVKSKDIDCLKNHPMFLIHVNIFCQTDDGIYYPAELAICEFNIMQGPVNTFHTFFDPGEVKKGYSFAVKEHSDKTHKITLQYVRKNSRFQDYERIFDDICRFLKLSTNQSVPLFTMYDDVFQNTNLTAVEKTLETLWECKHSARREDEAWRKYFPVYPLPLLFTHLKNYCYAKHGKTDVPFPNSSLAAIELCRDTYEFKEEFACDFHRDEEDAGITFCSRSYVSRWAQMMHDHCIVPFKNELEETETELDYNTVASASVYDDDEYEDDDHFTECQSVISGISSVSAMTNVTERSIQFGSTERAARDKEEGQSSNASQVSGRSSVWVGGRGRSMRTVAAPAVDDENFPALAGIGRGMRGMKLNR